jgi:hypothetical protein
MTASKSFSPELTRGSNGSSPVWRQFGTIRARAGKLVDKQEYPLLTDLGYRQCSRYLAKLSHRAAQLQPLPIEREERSDNTAATKQVAVPPLRQGTGLRRPKTLNLGALA